jgi:hypothetical protein
LSQQGAQVAAILGHANQRLVAASLGRGQ